MRVSVIFGVIRPESRKSQEVISDVQSKISFNKGRGFLVGAGD